MTEDSTAGPITTPASEAQKARSMSPVRVAHQHTGPNTPPASARVHTNEDAALADVAFTPTTSRINAAKDLPTPKEIDSAGPEQLRGMVRHLIEELTNARVAAANTKLQHNLLSMQTLQAAERAEVEHQLSKSQADLFRFKQAKTGRPSYHNHAVQPASREDLLTQTLHDLGERYAALEDMYEEAKQARESQQEHIQSLSEHNAMLVNRVRENREQFTRVRDHTPAVHTPREAFTTPRRKAGYSSRFPGDTPAHGPFAALIAADQILSQEVTSVPATPSRSNGRRSKGHIRAAHSLSSLQTPKAQTLPATTDHFLGPQLLLSAPAPQVMNESAEREQHDRDSTISASDNEAEDDNRASLSQASLFAADMLKRNPHNFSERPGSRGVEASSNLLQSKLFGPIKKIPSTKSSKLKRAYGSEGTGSAQKKARTTTAVGLGIEA